MKIALINVASTSKMINGRGPIFNDGSFIYIPIEEKIGVPERFPKYSRVIPSLYHDYLKNKEARVHNDPHFISFTYGHAIRGHGYEEILRQLEKDDILCFYGSFEFRNTGGRVKSWINRSWGSYIFGAYKIERVYPHKEFLNAPINIKRIFKQNPHYLRNPPKADYWILGQINCFGLFNISYPMSEKDDNTREGDLLEFFDVIDNRDRLVSYYRTAYICEEESRKVWSEIEKHSFV
ncbi:MAG: hypothetical protein HeimC3_53280 [Candidatus Heimdallarchaeota archaeon LC_3]|nr:MAG: hypothetical protein HeimC3_53280 [Candidatus Heimdallarchaeota archaeon LC_3]